MTDTNRTGANGVPVPLSTRTEPAVLTLSEQYELLAAERRRLTLDVLAGRTTPIDLMDLAAAVAAREDGRTATDETIAHVERTLHHVHLPTMADLDVVDYDPESHRVDPHPGRIESLPA